MAARQDYNPLPRTRVFSLGRLTVRFNWFVALCVVMTCGMFFNLGLWQLDRAAQKRGQEAAWQAMQQSDPLALEQLSPEQRQDGRPVVLEGSYLGQQVAFLVPYQFHRGQPGYEVLSPFRPASGDEPLVLVSRGWIAPAAEGRRPAVPDVPGERQQVIARLHVPTATPEPGRVTDRDWPVRLPRVDIAQAGRLLDEPLYPHVLRVEVGQPGALQRHWPAPEFGRRMHYVYAGQWFLFTALVIAGSLLMGTNILSLWRKRKSV